MSKLTGPLMSLDASGSIAGTLTYAKWKGRNYVRHLVKPANPKTPGQTSFRAMMSFLSKAWATINSGRQASWHTLAEQTKISDFNAYVKFNQKEWTQGITPTNEMPANPGTGPAVITSQSATGGIRQISVALGWATLLDNWGVILYRSLTPGFTPGQTDVVLVRQMDSGLSITLIDTPLAPDTYYYRFATFDHEGTVILNGTQVAATAT